MANPDKMGFEKILEQLGVKVDDKGNVSSTNEGISFSSKSSFSSSEEELEERFKKETGFDISQRVNNFDPANTAHVSALIKTMETIIHNLTDHAHIDKSRTILAITARPEGSNGEGEYSEVIFTGPLSMLLGELTKAFHQHAGNDSWEESNEFITDLDDDERSLN